MFYFSFQGFLPIQIPPPTVMDEGSRKLLSVIFSVFPEATGLP